MTAPALAARALRKPDGHVPVDHARLGMPAFKPTPVTPVLTPESPWCHLSRVDLPIFVDGAQSSPAAAVEAEVAVQHRPSRRRSRDGGPSHPTAVTGRLVTVPMACLCPATGDPT